MSKKDEQDSTVISKYLEVLRLFCEQSEQFIDNIVSSLSNYSSNIAYSVLILLFHAYFIAAGLHNFTKAFPLILTIIFLWFFYIIYLLANTQFVKTISARIVQYSDTIPNRRKETISLCGRLFLSVILIAYTVIDCLWTTVSRLHGFIGYAFFILLMMILSKNRRKINWKVVTNCLLMHYCLAIIILKWPPGKYMFQRISELIVAFLGFSQVGARFVYGFVANPPNICDLSPSFIFTALQTLIYFASIVSLLFYFGLIQGFLKKSAWFMNTVIGTSVYESVYAWACTFLGMSETPLLIAPYLEKMSDSEIFAILTSGFSCVGGTVFAAYVSLGACPEYLLTASILSAPLSLACSKIMYPEEKEVSNEPIELEIENEKGLMDRVFSAGVALVPTVFAIGATLVVVMSLLALLDSIMQYLGDLIGFQGWTFQMLFGYLFFPFAYIMGVNQDTNQTFLVAQLMGTKTAVNEFVAYEKLGKLQNSGFLEEKSVLISTYALCGFSNFGSIGIQMEVLGGLQPSKKSTISTIILRALCAGSISCFLNATIAGILTESPVICYPNSDVSSNSTCFRIN